MLTTVAADLLSLTLVSGPGRAGRRHRGGLGAAVRCAAVLRRPARRVHGGAVRVGAHAARTPGRRLRRRGRQTRLPARAADPRTAHPPGQGDQQHLHRAGAAGQRRGHVRRLPRPGRVARHRNPGAPATPSRWPPGLRAAGHEIVHDRFFDTVMVRVPGGARADRVRRRPSPVSTCAWSTPTTSVSPATSAPPTT